MIFGCPNCNADCPIPDDKIRNRILKVRCRHCHHIFYVKDPELDKRVTASVQAPPPPDDDDVWFYAAGDQSAGPVSVGSMRILIESAQILSSTLVWREGMEAWTPLADVPELTAILQAIASPPPPADAPVAPGLEDMEPSEKAVEIQEEVDPLALMEQEADSDISVDLDQETSSDSDAEDEEIELEADEIEFEEDAGGEIDDTVKALMEEEERLQQEREKKREQFAKRKEEEEKASKAEEEAKRKEEEEKARKAEEEAKRKAEEEKARKAEEEAKHKAEEEKARKAEEEAKRKAEEEKTREAEEEAKRKEEEEKAREVEEEAKRKAEEEKARKAEKKAKRKAEEEEKRLDAERRKLDEERKALEAEKKRLEEERKAAKAEKKTEEAGGVFVAAGKSVETAVEEAKLAERRRLEEEKKAGMPMGKLAVAVLVLIGLGIGFLLIFESNKVEQPQPSPGGHALLEETTTDANLFIPEQNLPAEEGETPPPAEEVADETEPKSEKQDRKVAEQMKELDSEIHAMRNALGKKKASPAAKSKNGKNAETKAVAVPSTPSGSSMAMPPVPSANDAFPEALLPSTLSQSQISSVVNRNLARIKFCYDSQLRRNPNLTGKVIVNFTVEGSGKVSSVAVKSRRFRGSYLDTCVTGAIRSWRFPRFSGDPVSVDYPFIFSAF